MLTIAIIMYKGNVVNILKINASGTPINHNGPISANITNLVSPPALKVPIICSAFENFRGT